MSRTQNNIWVYGFGKFNGRHLQNLVDRFSNRRILCNINILFVPIGQFYDKEQCKKKKHLRKVTHYLTTNKLFTVLRI